MQAAATPSIDPALPKGAKVLAGGGKVGDLAWRVFRYAFDFGFFVDGADGRHVFVGSAEHATAPKAERAAADWCRANPEAAAVAWDHDAGPKNAVDEQGFTPRDEVSQVSPATFDDGGFDFSQTFVEPPTRGWSNSRGDVGGRYLPGGVLGPPAPASINALGTHEIAGYRITVSDGRPGTFKAEVFDGAGKRAAADQDFTGRPTAKAALDDAAIWAMQHPIDGVPAVVFDDSEPVPAGHFIHDNGPEPEDSDIAGWNIHISDDRGAYKAVLTDHETGEEGPESFTFETEAGARQLAEEWAQAHPAASVRSQVHAGRRVDAVVAGSTITVERSASGKFEAVVADAVTGEPRALDEDLGGFDSWTDAFTAARKWAAENPTDAEDARRQAESDAYAAQLTAGPAEAPPAGTPSELEVVALRQQLALAIEQRDAALAGIAADARKGGEDAAEYRRLIAAKAQHQATISAAKDAIKGIDVRLGELGIGIVDLVEGLATGARGKAYQQSLTFDASTAVRASVGAQAEQQAAALGGPRVWAFNGVEHVIETSRVSMPDGPRWTAWLRGHRDATEGFGEDEGQAIENCKAAASIVFADCEPGQVVPTGPKLPAKRKPGRKPKLKSHSYDDVLKALREAMHTGDAAEALGVTGDELDAYVVRTGVVVSEHLARDIGRDETPAPAPKRGRGRRKAAAT